MAGRREDPGVPEALGRALHDLLEHLSPSTLDRIWLFPPLRKGRREHGLLAASRFPGADRGGERRVLVTLAYRAEETGRGVDFHSRFQEEGEAPWDRLPRVMTGVVRRAEAGPGDPIVVDAGESWAALAAALAEVKLPWEGRQGFGAGWSADFETTEEGRDA